MLDHAIVEFDYRGRHYTVTRDGGLFRYQQTYTDSTGAAIREVLSNDSLYREVNGQRVQLDSLQLAAVESALNSVVYFALLPYNLKDPAVRTRYLGEASISGTPYHEIEVTFAQEGGGKDHEDRYVYWINQETNLMDYFAYLYYTSGGGTRFRQTVNPRTISGVRFTDHLNYTSPVVGDSIETYDRLLASGDLELVSEIIVENVQVRPLNE